MSDLDEWTERHRNYTSVNISIDTGEPDLPWTFRPENDENRVDAVDPRINLIRVEEANWPRGIAGVSFEDLRRQVEAFQQSNNAAEIWLQRFVDLWNPERDKRPLFATTEMEVEDILQSDNPDWSERLRDRLG